MKINKVLERQGVQVECMRQKNEYESKKKLICVLREAVFGSWMGEEWNIPPDEGVVLLEENDTLNRGLF